MYLPNLCVHEFRIIEEKVGEDTLATSRQGNQTVYLCVFTLTGLLGMFIIGLWLKKLHGLDPRKFSRVVLQGLLSPPRAQLLTVLPVFFLFLFLFLFLLYFNSAFSLGTLQTCRMSLIGGVLSVAGWCRVLQGLERASPGWPHALPPGSF